MLPGESTYHLSLTSPHVAHAWTTISKMQRRVSGELLKYHNDFGIVIV